MKFSIIIPVYKPFFLRDYFDSILGQVYSNLEVIIMNDASPYNIDSIVQNYQDNRIHYYINEKNYVAEKMVDNWNKSLNYAVIILSTWAMMTFYAKPICTIITN